MKTFAASLAALSALIGFAPSARADATADYLAALGKDEVTYSNSTDIVNIGNTYCQQLRNKTDPGDAGLAIVKAGYTTTQAAKIGYDASHILCPDMGPVYEKWANS
jgi:uncharacterized protein DUF732